MSFGGSVAAMIASLKHNARPKRRPFDKDVPTSGQAIRREVLREPCQDDIARIQREMAGERRRDKAIRIGGAVLIVLVIIWVLGFSVG